MTKGQTSVYKCYICVLFINVINVCIPNNRTTDNCGKN